MRERIFRSDEGAYVLSLGRLSQALTIVSVGAKRWWVHQVITNSNHPCIVVVQKDEASQNRINDIAIPHDPRSVFPVRVEGRPAD
jgi:hypothetical protein